MNEDRDTELGRLLEASSEPEPDEAYWRQMEATLERESRMDERRGAWFGFGAHRRAWAVAATAVAAAVVVAVALFGLPGTGGRTGPAIATAAEVAAAMRAAATTYRTVQADFVHVDLDPITGAEGRSSVGGIASTDRGDSRITYSGEGDGIEATYVRSATTHSYLQLAGLAGGTNVAERFADAVPGTYMSPGGNDHYAWFVRAALVDGDPDIAVRNIVYEGRPAWSVSIPAPAASELDTLAEVVVDRQTGLLLRYEDSFQTVTYSRLRVDEALPLGLFSTRIPEGYRGTTHRADYYCSLRAVPARVGREPLIPAYVPEGYSLEDVATSPRPAGSWDGWQGPDPAAHDAHEAVHLRYRRAADTFAVDQFSLRPTSSHGRLSEHEVDGYYEYVDQLPTYRAVTLEVGRFTGRQAATFFDYAGANLIVHDDDLMVLISGALTRDEVVAVAESLEVRRP